MKIIADNNIPFLRGRLEPHADVTYVGQFEFTPQLVADADALLIRTRTRCDEALLGGSSVRLVATATIGMDQIDTAWCASAGIEVANAPGCNAPGVAQYVWSSLLRLGFDPGSQTLGVVGCGNVGSIVAEWGRKLGCRILVSDPPRQLAGLPAPEGCAYTSLADLLAAADAVTLHTPLNTTGPHATRHLISAPQLALMKPGAILVNAARGPVADTQALTAAISGRGIRAVIDTWEGEPHADPTLLRLAEIATFHIAGYSLQGKQRATRMALEAVARKFSLPIDLSGLEGPYRPYTTLTPAIITGSYDPFADMAPLKADPDAFDTLRAAYDFRSEPPHTA